jgi:hypothetical protein
MWGSRPRASGATQPLILRGQDQFRSSGEQDARRDKSKIERRHLGGGGRNGGVSERGSGLLRTRPLPRALQGQGCSGLQ